MPLTSYFVRMQPVGTPPGMAREGRAIMLIDRILSVTFRSTQRGPSKNCTSPAQLRIIETSSRATLQSAPLPSPTVYFSFNSIVFLIPQRRPTINHPGPNHRRKFNPTPCCVSHNRENTICSQASLTLVCSATRDLTGNCTQL